LRQAENGLTELGCPTGKLISGDHLKRRYRHHSVGHRMGRLSETRKNSRPRCHLAKTMGTQRKGWILKVLLLFSEAELEIYQRSLINWGQNPSPGSWRLLLEWGGL